jgi:hypothetical protein
MPADFFIDTRLGVVFSKATGRFSWSDAAGHMDRLTKHPDFRPEFKQLADFRQVTNLVLSHDELRRLAKRRVFDPRAQRAVVVSGDRELADEVGIMIFRDMEEALAWLSLPAEPDSSRFSRLEPSADDAYSARELKGEHHAGLREGNHPLAA